MIKENKIALSSWIYAAVYLIWGVLFYTLIPKFTQIFTEMGVTFPLPKSIVVSTPPVVWLVLYCVIAALVILRDITGKRSLFPNWIVLTLLIISVVFIIIVLFMPYFGPANA